MHCKLLKYLALFALTAILYSCFSEVFYTFSTRSEFVKISPAKIIMSTLSQSTFSDVPVKLEREKKYNWNYDGELNKKYKQFAPALNATEYKWYVELILLFKRQCEAYNITYLLEGGSVLGAYRYHGFVPWDDDFDIRVNSSQKETLKKALGSIPGHALFTSKHFQWKFYSIDNSIQLPRKWRWPFVDIFFFEVNSTHYYDVSHKQPRQAHPKSNILPFRTEIFENMIVPVPNNMEAYLSKRFNLLNPCKSNWYNHKKEKPPQLPSVRIPCEMLFNVYPVVHRIQVKGRFPYEELRLGNKILYRIQKQITSL